MKEKSEEKLLKEFIKTMDDPDKAEKRFKRYTKIAMFMSMLIILFVLSDNMDSIENKYYFALFAFISGTLFGLSLWFLQASTQTKIMVRHISKDSINKRIDEINS
jgi:hypothetical protein